MVHSKSHVEYWRKRLNKRQTKKNGSVYESKDFHVRISIEGSQITFNLDTANETKAATKARDIWLYTRSHSLSETLEKYKRIRKPVDQTTVGDLIECFEKIKPVSESTLSDYRRKFYFLLSEIFSIKGGKKKHDYYYKNDAKWRNKIERIQLCEITPDKLEKWRNDYINERSTSPLKRKQATITANSILRNSKSLFAKKHLRKFDLKIENNPFNEIEIHSNSTRRYQSKIDAEKLTQQAVKELLVEFPKYDPNGSPKARNCAISKHQQLKIFLLALGCGFRRGEIDSLIPIIVLNTEHVDKPFVSSYRTDDFGSLFE